MAYIDDLFSLEGKTALVTGGSRGLGAMIGEGLLRAGARVYLSSRSQDDCEQRAAKLSAYGECIALPGDVSTLAGIEALVGAYGEKQRKLDLLVNNAGTSWAAPLDDYPEAGWDKVMDLNVKGAFFLTQQLLPKLRMSASAQDPARVINIGSISGMMSESLSAYAYGPSKAAINHLTRQLAGDLAADNINVNSISPGFFPSSMSSWLVDDEEKSKQMLARIPRGRYGEPQDIIGLMLLMCSRAGAYMTGNVVPLDGGLSLKG